MGSNEPKPSRPPRLFIQEMVMTNFKSYAGEQRVGPFHKVRVSLSIPIFQFYTPSVPKRLSNLPNKSLDKVDNLSVS